jgi:hypothetical protein
LIPAEHWSEYFVDPDQIGHRPGLVWTITANSIFIDEGSYSALMVSHAQVERLMDRPLP